jgi:hypothetical protein
MGYDEPADVPIELFLVFPDDLGESLFPSLAGLEPTDEPGVVGAFSRWHEFPDAIEKPVV